MNQKTNTKPDVLRYLIFWFGQTVSQLGSDMTGFALTIWAYQQTGAALSVSLMTFCSYLPRILVSSVAGTVVDRNSKKKIMILADVIAELCTLLVIFCVWRQSLSIGVIYLVNVVIGISTAFQRPASSVALGLLVPNKQYERASGLQSFSGNLITVATPMLAGALLAAGGLRLILVIDLFTFLFATGSLLFFVPITETLEKREKQQKESLFAGFREGIAYLRGEKGLLYVMLFMALINFFSRLTYENIMAPMVLARSGSETVYGMVSAVLGAGGIVGGMLVTLKGKVRDRRKMIFLSAACSFVAGDLLFGAGQHAVIWCIGGFVGSGLIPFIMAGQHAVMYQTIPKEIQGRMFAVQSIVQYSSIPVGILLGGLLADYVFEPFMASGHVLAQFLRQIVGSGNGSGMAVMFLCTGILGAATSILGYCNRQIKELCERQ